MTRAVTLLVVSNEAVDPVAQQRCTGVAALLRMELGGRERAVLDGGQERHLMRCPGQRRVGGVDRTWEAVILACRPARVGAGRHAYLVPAVGAVEIDGDRIARITEGDRVPAGAIDCGGDHLSPGLVELHTDNLERHIQPRPGVDEGSAPGRGL